ncbi:MAG TPA: NAD(P)/FAD-dependent oxidoreductase [Mycobacteriales bacterium]|nr:NAD(P)/FAD-dependent oxidoreductase [Mycobacteriales bacterium]
MDPTGVAEQHVRVAVIGSGFGGIAVAVMLRRRGERSFVLLERGDDVGGTWRDNTYPGCACDVKSQIYSYSFALNPSWSRSFSPQPEIQAYLRRVADDFDVRGHVRLNTVVTGAQWDDDAQHWRIETSGGTFTADVLVAAGGGLSEPKIPDLPGLDTFTGELFHSAQWRHDVDLTGKRVAVVGTGASSIQITPHVAQAAAHTTVFQRTPPWVMPRNDRAISPRTRALFRRFPIAQRVARLAVYLRFEMAVLAFTGHPRINRIGAAGARAHLHKQVRDPELRKVLTPRFALGCKRVLLSDDYYPALGRPDVTVVPHGVTAVTPTGVVAADGSEHTLDAIVFSTGFHVTDAPLAAVLRDGAGRSIADVYAGSMQGYKGSTVAGFPNLFWISGPNSALGHNSIIFMIESQLPYLSGALDHLAATGAAAWDVDRRVQDAYNARLQRDLVGTVWNDGGCQSWYLDAHGRNVTIWPHSTLRYRRELRRFDPEAYTFLPRRVRESTPTELPV